MLKIKPHSVVSVITNSSTVIYTYTSQTSVNILKDIINHILEVSGVDKKADDLFTFEVGLSESEIDRVADQHWDEIPKDLKWAEQMAYVEAKIKAGEWEEDPKTDYWDSYGDEGRLIVKAKNGNEETEKVFSKLYGLFTHEASYDG